MEKLIEDLEQQLAFENQRTLTHEDEMNGWNSEYQEGYKAGLRQAIACLKLAQGACAFCGEPMYTLIRAHHHTENGVDVTQKSHD